MSFLRRVLGIDPLATPHAPADEAETATVRRIVARLEALPPAQARYLAGFAYVLARVAHADLEISDAETAAMEGILSDFGGLDSAQAVLVVELAKIQARTAGETEDFLVTREFARLASPEQRRAVVRACYAVTAADDSISAPESTAVREIADELGLDSIELASIRSEYSGKLSALRALREHASS